MVKMGKSSNKFNLFLSRVYVSPGHAASFTGLDKLYHTVRNHFPVVKRKQIGKWSENDLSYLLRVSSRRTFK